MPAMSRWSARSGPSTRSPLALARLVVRLLVPAGALVTLAVDDTLFPRRGKKVWAAGWFHDGSAVDTRHIGYGRRRITTKAEAL